MGGPVMADGPVYLDDQGNPVSQAAPAASGTVYLDEQGNPQASSPSDRFALPPGEIKGPEPGLSGTLNRAEGKLESFVGGEPFSGGARDYLLSPERGALHMAQGAVQGDPWRVVKGALEAMTIPTLFVGPETKVASNAMEGAANVATKGGRARMLDQKALGVLNKIAEDSGLAKLDSGTVREGVTELASKFKDRAQAMYKPVDEAVQGNLKPLLKKIDEVREAMNQAVDPEQKAKLADDLIELGARKKDAIARAIQNGVEDAERIIKRADQDWSQGKNIERLAQRFKSATGEIVDAGVTNAKKLANRLDAANNKTRGKKSELVRALGDKAEEMKDVARQALSRERTADVVKTGLKYGLGAAGVGGLGYGLLKLFGAEK